MIHGFAPPTSANNLRAAPLAQTEKSRENGSFLCTKGTLAVWKYGGGHLSRNLHPNAQPSARVRHRIATLRYGLRLWRRPKRAARAALFFARVSSSAYGNTAAGCHSRNLHPNAQPSAWVRHRIATLRYGLRLWRRPKRAAKAALFFARTPPLPYENTAAGDAAGEVCKSEKILPTCRGDSRIARFRFGLAGDSAVAPTGWCAAVCRAKIIHPAARPSAARHAANPRFPTISCKPVAFCICILTFPARRAMIFALCRFGTKNFLGDTLCLN